MSGRVRVLCGRVSVGKKSLYKPDCTWSSLVGEFGNRGDRVHLIGSENVP